jgi:hypothetical protein
MGDCKCGCEEETTTGKDFKRGHDSKLRIKIEDEVGGIFALEKLVMAAKDYSCRKIKEGEFLKVVRKIFAQ